MKTIRLLLLGCLFFTYIQSNVSADENAVRAVIKKYVEAFNQQDIDTIAGLWSKNGTHIDRITGERTEGGQAIASAIQEYFKAEPKAQLSGKIDSVREITSNVIQVEGETTIMAPEQEPLMSKYSAVLVKSDDKWLIDSIEELPENTFLSSKEALEELKWLVGNWIDESDETRVETTFRWTPSETFLLRSYVASNKDGVVSQGTQIIGWDPRAEQIRSWSFNSDGSFGGGFWTHDGDTWMIQSAHTLSNGETASGTYVLKKLDENSLTLQLVGHEVEGEPQPTSPEVKVIRVPEEEKSN